MRRDISTDEIAKSDTNPGRRPQNRLFAMNTDTPPNRKKPKRNKKSEHLLLPQTIPPNRLHSLLSSPYPPRPTFPSPPICRFRPRLKNIQVKHAQASDPHPASSRPLNAHQPRRTPPPPPPLPTNPPGYPQSLRHPATTAYPAYHSHQRLSRSVSGTTCAWHRCRQNTP